MGDGGNDGEWKGPVANSTFYPDNDGWLADKAYGAYECAKFGTGSIAGKATTPAIAIDGEVILTFRSGAWDGRSDGTTLNLSVSNGTISQSSVTMKKGEFTDYELTITASGSVAITFSTTLGRFFLDEVVVKKESQHTAIRSLDVEKKNSGRVYTLDGRYVGSDINQLSRGLYIIDGKKVMK